MPIMAYSAKYASSF
ncbi:MAG: hypothetical protein ACLT9Y_04575 [Peptostreptococcus anaerobius]